MTTGQVKDWLDTAEGRVTARAAMLATTALLSVAMTLGGVILSDIRGKTTETFDMMVALQKQVAQDGRDIAVLQERYSNHDTRLAHLEAWRFQFQRTSQ